MGQMINEQQLRALQPADAGKTIRDGSGLSGKVKLGGKGTLAVYFRYRYTFAGRPEEIACGAWPRNDLASIRNAMADARQRIAAGFNPSGKRKLVATQLKVEQAEADRRVREETADAEARAIAQKTIHDLFLAWSEKQFADHGEKSRRACIRKFELHVLPVAGTVKVSDFNPDHAKEIARRLCDARKYATAVNLQIWLLIMFTWALKRKPWKLLIDGHPVEEFRIGAMLPSGYTRSRKRVFSIAETRDLQARFTSIRAAWEEPGRTKRGRAKPLGRELELAIWIMLSTLARINELCAAPWSNVNLREGTWFIPAEQSKNGRAHTIYLSTFARKQLAELHLITGHTPWVLPADPVRPVTTAVIQCQLGYRQCIAKDWQASKQVAEITAASLLLDDGLWSAHDLRRTGASFMQAIGISSTTVERCLNHKLSKEERERGLNPMLIETYQQYDYAPEKRAAWQRLGQYLDDILSANDDAFDVEEMLLDMVI